MKVTDSKILVGVCAVLVVVACMVVLNLMNGREEPTSTRMEAVGYSIGTSGTTVTTVTTVTTTTTTEATTTLESETTPEETTEPLVPTVVDHSSISRASLPSAHSSEVANLKSSNPDTKGWISLSNTSISYAFTQTDNDSYYLDHDFYGNEDGAGWIFIDYRASFDDDGQQSDVVTFYGHNMANGSMFATLKKYRDNPDFYEANPIITVSYPNGYSYYKVFAYMVCNGLEGSDFEFWKYSDLSNPDDFYYYVNSAFNKSMVVTGVDVQYGDKLIALSTCNSGSSSNHDRFVVLARKVRDGEDLYEGCYRVG